LTRTDRTRPSTVRTDSSRSLVQPIDAYPSEGASPSRHPAVHRISANRPPVSTALENWTVPDARIAARAKDILTSMSETLPSTSLDNALTVPGFETKRDARRVVFTFTDGPRRVVIWRVSGDALTKHVASLRPHARAAWGARSARGEWLLAVHVEEA
jgi:hypothetical protein